jgi:hypothetical protein
MRVWWELNEIKFKILKFECEGIFWVLCDLDGEGDLKDFELCIFFIVGE